MRPPGRIYQRWPWVEHFDLPPGYAGLSAASLPRYAEKSV